LCKILISAIFLLMNSNIHKLFGQKTNYYQIKALDFVSYSYLLIIGLLTSLAKKFPIKNFALGIYLISVIKIFLINDKNKNIAQKQIYCFQRKNVHYYATDTRLLSSLFSNIFYHIVYTNIAVVKCNLFFKSLIFKLKF
jgi:hypothetical protein